MNDSRGHFAAEISCWLRYHFRYEYRIDLCAPSVENVENDKNYKTDSEHFEIRALFIRKQQTSQVRHRFSEAKK